MGEASTYAICNRYLSNTTICSPQTCVRVTAHVDARVHLELSFQLAVEVRQAVTANGRLAVLRETDQLGKAQDLQQHHTQ